jgi:phosphopantetheine adenylyltransferase / dephospho-CoA kinase
MVAVVQDLWDRGLLMSDCSCMDMLGTRLRLPDAPPNLPNDPYIIGLMEGIASGKSCMAERFEKLGANIIDCDKLAHQLYEPGEDCFNAIKDYFGSQIRQ